MSPARELFLGLDVGTQSTKALVFDPGTGQVVERSSVGYGLIEGLPAGHAEQHPMTWHDAVIESVGRLGCRAEISGIGVSGQQHGAVLLGKTYDVVRAAKLWCDTSTAGEAARLTEQVGRAIPTGFTAPKLRYIADHEPEVWDRTAHAILPHDFINACLTHDLFTEVGDASGTGYLDPVTGEYDPSAVEATAPGLREKLPRLVPCDEVAGHLVPSTAESLGLRPGIPVSAGGGDNMMSAIGSGAIEKGVVTCSLGTSGTIFAFTDAPCLDPGGLIAPFRASSPLPGDRAGAGHLPLLCVMNCTEPLAGLCALTGKTHAELTEMARRVPIGCSGTTFVPFLAGERVPNLPGARGSITGLSLSSLEPGILYRAALEGVALNLAAGLGRMRDLGLSPSVIRLVGGAAKNALWPSILAGAFDCAVEVLEETETAALGAAIQAAASVRGVPVSEIQAANAAAAVSPQEQDRSAYADLRERFAAAVDRVAD